MIKFLFVAMMLTAASCIPQRDGKRAAEEKNRCVQACIESLWELENDFYKCFNPLELDFLSRDGRRNDVTVLLEYREKYKEIGEAYYRDIASAKGLKERLREKYKAEGTKLAMFDAAYAREIEQGLSEKADSLFRVASDAVPFVVYCAIYGIIPDRPDPKDIHWEYLGNYLSVDAMIQHIRMCELVLIREEIEINSGEIGGDDLFYTRQSYRQITMEQALLQRLLDLAMGHPYEVRLPAESLRKAIRECEERIAVYKNKIDSEEESDSRSLRENLFRYHTAVKEKQVLTERLKKDLLFLYD